MPRVLHQDVSREQLTFSLAQFTQVTNNSVRAVAEGLPPNLLMLDLDFQGCRQITGLGIRDLAERLPKTLRKLRLKFVACSGISDAAVIDLVCNIPPNIKELTLDFGMCPQISTSSIQALASGLPEGITSFFGQFKGTQINCNYESLMELRQAATKLTVLGRVDGWMKNLRRD